MLEKAGFKKFPYDICDLNPQLNRELLQHFKGEHSSYVQVGPDKWLMPNKYKTEAEKLYNFQIRQEDVWIVTYPRSGTTWTQEMTWLIANDLDFDTANKVPLMDRFPFLEFYTLNHENLLQTLLERNSHCQTKISQVKHIMGPVEDQLMNQKGRRFIKTHLPFSLLNPDLLHLGCKVIYVARNPKDVAVSYYHLHRFIKNLDFKGDFKQFWNYFVRDLVLWSPYWNHVKQGWKERCNPNVLFLFYENLKTDLRSNIIKIAQFLGKPAIKEEQLIRLEEHLNFENFKNNGSVNVSFLSELGLLNSEEPGFIRNGKICGWKGYFNEEMEREANDWIQKNLKGSSMRFPL